MAATPVRQTSTRWTGYYTPARAGGYGLFVQLGGFGHGIGYRLYVDDKLVTDRWTRKTAALEATRSGSEAFAAIAEETRAVYRRVLV